MQKQLVPTCSSCTYTYSPFFPIKKPIRAPTKYGLSLRHPLDPTAHDHHPTPNHMIARQRRRHWQWGPHNPMAPHGIDTGGSTTPRSLVWLPRFPGRGGNLSLSLRACARRPTAKAMVAVRSGIEAHLAVRCCVWHCSPHAARIRLLVFFF